MKEKIFIGLTQHLGDIIATEPTLRYLREKHPDAFICWFVQEAYVPLLENHPGLNKTVTVTCLTEWLLLKKFLPSKKIIDLHIDGKICDRHGFLLRNPNNLDINQNNYYNKGNLLFASSRSAGIDLDAKEAPRQYMEIETGPVHNSFYLVVHTSSNEKQRELLSECWTAIAETLLKRFNGIKIIEVGYEQYIKTNDARYINLTGRRDLNSIANLIFYSRLFIGIDSGFAHLANAMEIEAVIILGELNAFKNYMPYSGKYQREQATTIFNYSGKLKHLDWKEVFPFIEQKLVNLV